MSAELSEKLLKFHDKMASNYSGEELQLRNSSKGRYNFPNGVVYEGEFYDGYFHGSGSLHFPDRGTFMATWERGKALQGAYIYKDGLEFKDVDWSFCTENDRRFWSEIKSGSAAIFNNLGPVVPLPEIPPFCYDVIEGYFNPKSRQIFTYEVNNFY